MGRSDTETGFVGEVPLPRLGDWIDGRYQLVRHIGEGGMGHVFEARHKLMDTTYALKFLKEEYAAQPDLAARFLREARIAGRIDNPHVVKVFDVNTQEGGLPYMVMELLGGETLHDRCREAGDPLDALEIHEIALQVLDGVAAAHRLGVVHRDLKPANVMLTKNDVGERVVKVLDFGLAKLLEAGGSGGVTEPGTVLGTANYMPPEQAFGQQVDQRADVFALGVIFFELIAGTRPVDGEAPAEIASNYVRGRVKRLEDLVPAIDPSLAAAIHKALEPNAEDRFDSAVEFRAAYATVPPPAPRDRREPARPSPTLPDASAEESVVPWPARADALTESPGASRHILAIVVVGVVLAALIAWATWSL